MFVIDGLVWDIKCEITRTTQMKDSEISGMMMNKVYFHDVIGTYIEYEIELPAPMYLQQNYATIYDLMSQPVGGHTWVLPYNEEFITLTGKVDKIKDVYVEMPGGRIYWKGTKFTISGSNPIKTMSLGEVITRGLEPVPNVMSPQIGDQYTWDGTKWVVAHYEDADDISY